MSATPDLAPVTTLRPWHETRVTHVWPGNDRIGHELWPGCACDPELRTVPDGPNEGAIYVHHALDGRRN